MLDFSKAFDKVPHQRLAAKLHHYGIRGKSLQWIQGFLSNSVLYCEIKGPEDHVALQKDLNAVFAWADKWQMSFNASKCQHLTVTPLNTLGIIRRNLGPCSKDVKLKAYQTLVRPQLEYAATAWSPYTARDVKPLEMVQRQAVRFICGEFHRKTSVTPLLDQLQLDQLATRRVMSQCTMFYKIHHGLVNISFPPNIRLHPTSGRLHNLRYLPVLATRNTYKYSFFVRTIPTWNRLPAEAVAAPSVNVFQAIALPAVRVLQPTATHQVI
ncbi:uncharacterized protein [Amphiura filiformis]|uniref:uncharacterized protein n=1 Tax=Amphiura filiformis TaxID=82378 RepID=UPI003B22481E